MMMKFSRLLAAALCLASLQAAAFDLQGHRGARGLAPENTLPSFAAALTIGVTTIETDDRDHARRRARDLARPGLEPRHQARPRRPVRG